jgi:elongation factor Ts
MMDCKRALTEASGDMEKAVEILRKRGKDVADKKVGRETAEGRVAAFVDQGKKVGALVEVLCESAPVAKSDLFIQLANDLARQVALEGATTAEALLAQKFINDPSKTVGDRVSEVIGLIRENMKPARITRLTGLLGSYCHHDGSVGVLLQVEGKDTAEPQLLRDVCMHITAVNPVAARREDVPKDLIEREMEVARGQAEATGKGKPANIIEKIAEGKLKTWFAEKVLVEQPFVKDPSKTVGDLLKSAGLQVVKFVRYKIGEAS